METLKRIPDKLELLLTKEVKIRKQLVDIRSKINAIKHYRKKIKAPLNLSLKRCTVYFETLYTFSILALLLSREMYLQLSLIIR